MVKKSEIAFWIKLLGRPPKVYAIMYYPDEEDNALMGICRTRELAEKEIKKLMQEYFLKDEDFVVEEWELIV